MLRLLRCSKIAVIDATSNTVRHHYLFFLSYEHGYAPLIPETKVTARMVVTGSSAHPYEVTLTACRSFAELADGDLNQMWIQYTCRKIADVFGY